MSLIKNILESVARQIYQKPLHPQHGPLLIALAIFYLAEVIREKELK